MMVDVSKITCCFVYVIGIALAVPAAEELPNEFVPCSKSDPKLGECLKTSLQNNIPNLVNGVLSIGLLSIDPFRVTSLKIDQGTGPVRVKLNFNDLDVSNIGTAKINEINADVVNYNFTLDVSFEKPITLDGYYDVKGKVMILPITGNGKSKISLDDVKAKVNAHLKKVVKNEGTYLELQDISLTFTTSRMHIKLDNLFNGDQVLGNNMNTFLNENWKEVLRELQSSIEKALITIISDVAKLVLDRVPMNQILKD